MWAWRSERCWRRVNSPYLMQKLVCLGASGLAMAYSSHSGISVTQRRLFPWCVEPMSGAHWWLQRASAGRAQWVRVTVTP